MKFETIIYEKEGPIAWITLNRPEKLNAINKPMVKELLLATDKAQEDDDVRVIILTGEGRAFSAGFDLEFDPPTDRTEEQARLALKNELHNDFDMIMRFWHSPKPTIAAVHTYCLGGAMELAVACDITIAARGCRFGEPEVKFGGSVVAMLLPYICGPKRTKEILLTGNDRISPEQAQEWGLINRVVKQENLLEEARQLALEIAHNDQLAVRITKQAINMTYEFGKMRNALKHALERAIVVEGTETEESRQFNEILRKEGAKAAINWRDRQMGYTGQVKNA